jgi:hypothetical protein
VEIDEYDLVDPVNILTPLEKSGFWDGVVHDLSCMHILFSILSYTYMKSCIFLYQFLKAYLSI